MVRENRIGNLNYEWKQFININASPSYTLKATNKPIASGILGWACHQFPG